MTLTIDETSLVVSVSADTTLGALEAALAAHDLTLGVPLGESARSDESVANWLGRGAPGTPPAMADPADHLMAGFAGELPTGRELVVRPEPRRAVGPDLAALVLGARGRFLRLSRAELRVHRKDAPRPSLPLPTADLDPPLTDAEERLLASIAEELKR